MQLQCMFEARPIHHLSCSKPCPKAKSIPQHISCAPQNCRNSKGLLYQPQHTTQPGQQSKVAAAGKGGASREDEIWSQLSSMADKYLFAGAGPPTQRRASSSSSGPLPVQAIHILLCCYVAVWLLTTLPLSSSGPLMPLKLVSLDQLSSGSSGLFSKGLCLLTDALLSPSSTLLARNLFFGYMFGRVVENTESSGALWLTFVLSALGGSTAGLLLLPRRAPLQGCAATAALFGLFSAATLFNRHKLWHWQRGFELCVLLPFVLQQMLAGHQGLTQWCSLVGFRLPGAWVPLLGGLAGAAAAAGVMVVVRAVQSSIETQRQHEAARQRQQQQQQQLGGESIDQTPMSVLLARAAAQLLQKGLGGK